jgi:hypothetical protein
MTLHTPFKYGAHLIITVNVTVFLDVEMSTGVGSDDTEAHFSGCTHVLPGMCSQWPLNCTS